MLMPLVFAAGNLRAQSNTRLSGTVISKEDGSVVPHAELSLLGTSYRVTTDDAGSFAFDNVPLGIYRLRITAPGFETNETSDLQLLPDITRQVRITLDRKTYPVSGVTVKGVRQIQPNGVTVVDRQQIERLHPEDVSDILETVEGVQVERAGPGGQATIRIRGSSTNQVLVLLDGHRLNAASSGVADLNSVPVSAVERIELYKSGASAQFGPDALAGAVNIITHPTASLRPATAEATVTTGSFGTRRQSVSLEVPINSVNVTQRVALDNRTSEGDFDYNYHVSPGNTVYHGPRINNASSSRSFFGSGTMSHSSTQLGYSFQLYDAGNGLPDKASGQNENAYREDDRLFFSSRLDHQFSHRLGASLSGGYSRGVQFFSDRFGPLLNQYETRYTDKNLDVKGEVVYQTGDLSELRAGYQYRYAQLDHEDLLRTVYATAVTRRRTNSFFVSSRYPFDLSRSGLLDDLTLTASLRYDHATTDPDKKQILFPQPLTRHVVHTESWSPRLGITITRGDRLRLVSRASWGRSLNLPSFSALFWQGTGRSAGNPDLRPERAEHLDGSLEVSTKVAFITFAAGMTFYRKDVEDLTLWLQSSPDGAFKPQNLGFARIKGHEDFVKLTLFNDVLEMSYGNSITHALNKRPDHHDYDKSLVYTPPYVTTFSLSLAYGVLFASYDIRWVGRRYALSGNEKWYDPYRLHDLTVGSELNIAEDWRLRLDGRINNLSDEPYVLIAQHPMPGRAYNLSLTISYQPKGTKP
ncbi:MAG: TonB-dependent receptor [candidate division Zixibacteria bacterium]|nr:TonB-dependent receptor [candidate division Zixibacteria bacterium]